MNYSAVLEIECPFPEVCEAAGVQRDSRFGDVLIGLIDKLSQNGGRNVVIGFTYGGVTEIDALINHIKAEHLCESCDEKIKLMLERLRKENVIPETPGSNVKDRYEAIGAFRAN